MTPPSLMFWTSWRAWSTNRWWFRNGGAGWGATGCWRRCGSSRWSSSKQCDEAADVRRRHAAYFVALAEEAEDALMGSEQRAWQARLEDEHNNIQVTFDWLASAEARSVQARPEEAALRMAGALWRYWEVRGHVAEGRARLLPLLAAADPETPAIVRARGHLGAGICTWYQGDFETATAHYETSVELYRGLGDRRGVARPLTYLGWLNTLSRRVRPRAGPMRGGGRDLPRSRGPPGGGVGHGQAGHHRLLGGGSGEGRAAARTRPRDEPRDGG